MEKITAAELAKAAKRDAERALRAKERAEKAKSESPMGAVASRQWALACLASNSEIGARGAAEKLDMERAETWAGMAKAWADWAEYAAREVECAAPDFAVMREMNAIALVQMAARNAERALLVVKRAKQETDAMPLEGAVAARRWVATSFAENAAEGAQKGVDKAAAGEAKAALSMVRESTAVTGVAARDAEFERRWGRMEAETWAGWTKACAEWAVRAGWSELRGD